MIQQLVRTLEYGRPLTLNSDNLSYMGYEDIEECRVLPIPNDTSFLFKYFLFRVTNYYRIGRCVSQSFEKTHFCMLDFDSCHPKHVARRDIKGIIISIQFVIGDTYDT